LYVDDSRVDFTPPLALLPGRVREGWGDLKAVKKSTLEYTTQE